MTSSNDNIPLVTGPLWGESTGHRWIPLTKASDAELWCFLWSVPEQTVEQKINIPVIWEAIAPIMTSLQWISNVPGNMSPKSNTLYIKILEVYHWSIEWSYRDSDWSCWIIGWSSWSVDWSHWRDQSRYTPSQWEMPLHRNDVPRWLAHT